MENSDRPVGAEPATAAEKPGLDLKAMTDARVRLGRFGSGQPTRTQLGFLLDHARAREAVWTSAGWDGLKAQAETLGLASVDVESLAVERSLYLRRPDLGRRLSEASVETLRQMRAARPGPPDVVITVADGLSSSAVDINAGAMIAALAARLAESGLTLAPIVFASQARVALSDPVGEIFGAAVSIILIGERPGLSAADSLGAYLTFEPRPGTPDSRRNCISNIRDGGMPIAAAASAIAALAQTMIKAKTSGVALKDAAEKLLIDGA